MDRINAINTWTATITPMSEGGSIDYDSFTNTLQAQSDAGNGALVLGSTGEALNIDLAERKKIVEFAVGLKLDVPVMIGVGGSEIDEQIKWIEYLNSVDGIDAYLVVVPLYAKPDTHGQYEWFKTLLDAADRPCMIYNVPSRTGKPLSFETTEMLADHPKFWAIKDASGSTDDFEKYSKAAPNARIMSGDDAMTPDFAKLGGQGVVSVASNVWPAAVHEFSKQCIAGSLQEVDEWKNWAKSLFCAANPVPAKVLMAHKGDIASNAVRLPLSVKDMPDMSIVTDADEAVTDWLKNTTPVN